MIEGGDPQPQGKPLAGYAVSIGIVLAAFIAFGVLLAGAIGDDDTAGGDVAAEVDDDGGNGESGGRGGDSPDEDMLPDGGSFATPREFATVARAAEAAGCELESHRARTRNHVSNLRVEVEYSSAPPTSGLHYPVPAGDAAYEVSPDVKLLVHSLEHGRVIVWFDPELPAEARAALKAFYDNDSDRVLLVPDPTDMPYEVAATAWNENPGRHGTGRLLGCPEHGEDVFGALEAFKDRHRGKGPERVP